MTAPVRVYDINPDDGYALEQLCDSAEASIDWLTITVKDDTNRELVRQEAGRLFTIGKANGNVQRPWNFKGYAGWMCAGVRWGERKDSSILMLSGLAAALNYAPALAWATNITRVDLAVTIDLITVWPGIVKRAYDFLFLDGHKPCSCQRKYTFIQNKQGGQTLYIGARTSDQYGRFYDKGKEDASLPDMPPGKLYRYEVEFKKYRAKKIGGQLLAAARAEESHPAGQIERTVYKWFLSRGVKPIWTTDDENVGFSTEISASLSDDETSLRWLSTQVNPTVRRLVGAGKGDQVRRALGL